MTPELGSKRLSISGSMNQSFSGVPRRLREILKHPHNPLAPALTNSVSCDCSIENSCADFGVYVHSHALLLRLAPPLAPDASHRAEEWF